MPRNLSEKVAAKLPATTLSNSMVKISHGKDAVSDIFYLEAGRVEGQLLLQKDQKRRNWKGEKEINKTQKS